MTKTLSTALLILTVLLCADAPRASDLAVRQEFASRMLEGPCRTYRIPKLLALAIARQESDYNPWTINVEGRDYQAKDAQEALRIAERALRSGRSFDVGLMQVNSYWIREYGWPLRVVLDPRNNAKIGCWILAGEIRRHGMNWKAVAYYHTPLHKHPERGIRYARSIVSQIHKIKNNQ